MKLFAEHLSTSMSSLGGFAGGRAGAPNANRGTVGRTIAGVFSGAAANIKSRFSNLNTVNNVAQTPSPGPEQYFPANSSQKINLEQGQSSDVPLSKSTAAFSNMDTFQSSSTQYSHQQYSHQINNRWQESQVGHFADNKFAEHMPPNELPVTVPGSDMNFAFGTVPTLPYGETKTTSNNFGKSILNTTVSLFSEY